MSVLGEVGLHIDCFDPFVLGGRWLYRLTELTNSYSHEVLADGGYWQAQINIRQDVDDLEDWFENGLGRGIQTMDEAGETVFKGFVNQVTLNLASATKVRGPLMNLCNRSSATYTPVDYSTYPPVIGTQTVTLISDDVYSQSLYGIIEKTTNAGQCTETMADQIRDVFLRDNRFPTQSDSLALTPGGGQEPSVTLDVLGNVHWLGAYIYNNIGDVTLGFLTDKIKNVLAADPNFIISSDYGEIYTNANLVPMEESKNRAAWDIIRDALKLGDDSTDDRIMFGVHGAKDIPYLLELPNSIEYEHRISDAGLSVVQAGRTDSLAPWEVQPGKFMLLVDFLAGKSVYSDSFREDPRVKFVESVRYTAPWGLDVMGGKLERLSQVLAKIGGMG